MYLIVKINNILYKNQNYTKHIAILVVAYFLIGIFIL